MKSLTLCGAVITCTLVAIRAAMATRFVIPVVVNGHVYFAARGEVEVYGLLSAPGRSDP